MKQFEGYTYVDGGVCAAKGFKANGVYSGIDMAMKQAHEMDLVANGVDVKATKNDLGMVVSDELCNTAAVYTTNKVKGAPILVTKENLAKTGGKSRAVIVNSKNANTCNTDGVKVAEEMCDLTAKVLDIKSEEVVVASTGVIGIPLPIKPIADHINELADGLSYEGNAKVVNAIMTTDTVPKEVAVTFEINGTKCTLGGMAKGSGMIHPNMATTLNFITSDVAIDATLMQKALSEVTKITYNCLSIDGDTSTNDMVCVMANGLSGNEEIVAEDAGYESFKQALYIVMMNLTRMLAKDGEGATKLIECTVDKAKDLDTAITVAKSVVASSLFKCAIFGEDANWGRIACAIGYADCDVIIEKIDVDMVSAKGTLEVCRGGYGVDFSEDFAKEVLSEDEIMVNITLNDGEAKATAWGCDLTYDYVKINGDYRS
ncbi:MAG: bifunctional glutamate N-acetyltransferase/amino-acid acetyltransferase ArgJ [Lachnospiraceae bacterium]|nr:bifunctional glutamate N-acetyltransferase/amino-acid acetyltransferase ArgJ [Lachnospiraceae bacterium]